MNVNRKINFLSKLIIIFSFEKHKWLKWLVCLHLLHAMWKQGIISFIFMRYLWDILHIRLFAHTYIILINILKNLTHVCTPMRARARAHTRTFIFVYLRYFNLTEIFYICIFGDGFCMRIFEPCSFMGILNSCSYAILFVCQFMLTL